MPLMVPKRLYQSWLHGDKSLLQSPPEIDLRAHPVGMAVNQAASDSPRLIEPVELARGLFD
jgi:putative SOS response-associated peptidase YedK